MKNDNRPIFSIDMEEYYQYMRRQGIQEKERMRRCEKVWTVLEYLGSYGFRLRPHRPLRLPRQPLKPRPNAIHNPNERLHQIFNSVARED